MRRQQRFRLAVIGFAVVAAFFLLLEHRAHVLPYVPWLLLAACPLLHAFMHGGGAHGGHGDDEPGKERER